jgi:hypothetical protein
METNSTPPTLHELSCKWNLYYHLQTDASWTLDSYKIIMKGMDSVECVNSINEKIPEYLLYNCMFFCMKDGITPTWEDVHNRDGGCFSYRVSNNDVSTAWRKLLCAMSGGSLCVNPKYESHINGITISPKKRFSVIKVWLNTCKLPNPDVIRDIQCLNKDGCLFKKHSPEF